MKALAVVKDSAKLQIKSLARSSWELPRSVWELFNPPSANVIAERQKTAYMKQAPGYMTQIMSRVLAKNSNCIDVGCHSGAILASMLDFAPLGHHYAFEPIPSLAEILKEKFPEVDIHPGALSSSEGDTEFHHIVSRPTYSGLKQRPLPSNNETVEIIKVKTQRLDDVLSPDFKVHFIKVDVEGAELEVFKGAIRTLRMDKPYVLFEHGPLSSKCYGSNPHMIYELLVQECGLKIFGLDDWLRNSNPLSQDKFASIQASGVMWDYLATP